MTKIMIVEDEEAILTLLSEQFNEMKDYTTICARNGEEALRVLGSEVPDIVLLDSRIPKLSGAEVCRSIRANPSLSKVKILMISGIAQEVGEEIAAQAGADSFLSKPFRLSELKAKVKTLLKEE